MTYAQYFKIRHKQKKNHSANKIYKIIKWNSEQSSLGWFYIPHCNQPLGNDNLLNYECSIKKNPQLSWKVMKTLLPFLTHIYLSSTYLSEVGFCCYASIERGDLKAWLQKQTWDPLQNANSTFFSFFSFLFLWGKRQILRSQRENPSI